MAQTTQFCNTTNAIIVGKNFPITRKSLNGDKPITNTSALGFPKTIAHLSWPKKMKTIHFFLRIVRCWASIGVCTICVSGLKVVCLSTSLNKINVLSMFFIGQSSSACELVYGFFLLAKLCLNIADLVTLFYFSCKIRLF